MSNKAELLGRLLSGPGISSKRPALPSPDEIDLVMAWFMGTIESSDLVRVYGSSGTAPAVYRAARVLRQLAIDGDVVQFVDRREEKK